MTEAGSYRLGFVLVTASAVAWSTAGLFTRLITVDTGAMLVWRGIFGALGLLAVIVAIDGRSGVKAFGRMGVYGWMFAIVSAIGMLCFISALRSTTVAHVAIIYATVPLVAAVLAWLVLAESPTGRAIQASLVAMVGVVLMVGMSGEGSWSGDVLAFGMTLSLAVMMVIARRSADIPVMPAACLSALLSGLVAIPFSDDLAVGWDDIGLLALFGVVNSALGLSLFALGARMLPAIETALIGALDAPLAPIWVWLIFAETPAAVTLAGGLIVFFAVALHLSSQWRQT